MILDHPTSEKTKRPVWAAWVLAIKPKTLTASIVPVLLGLACSWHASGRFHVWTAVATLLAACLIQVGTNFANDVFDFYKGADTEERLGAPKPIQMGWLTPRQLLGATVFVFVAALLLGVYLAIVSGPWIVLLGLVSLLSGLAYTAGPYPLAYHGLGDLFVFLFFGVAAVCGTMFVQTGSVSLLALLLSVPMGFLATAVLVANNVRDVTTDAKVAKKTLVVRFGHRFGVYEYVFLIVASYAFLFLPWAFGSIRFFVLLPFLSFPMVFRLLSDMFTKQGKDLRSAVGHTARLEMVFGLLLSCAVALGRFL